MMALAMTARSAGEPSPTPAELERATLERARAGEPLALRAFVVRYERPVFALLSRMLGRGPHVEDLAQETFLRAIRALPSFRPDGPARQLPLAAPGDADAVVDASTPETLRARRELGRRLEKAAGALSDDHRAALLLVEVHGFTLAEVGEALGIPEATAKTRLFRARQHMREALADLRQTPDAEKE
jgi:RNA polymerase sigma-70 factor (ECF subfamily)